ncbi:DUF423 domain-containing protein [Phenylobacterium sp.]|jgi:uncharacterized membrane protein YgdD (TMEM256/DUF423 family)|uniref:DUF423 domain-containing protein n=1 Tax=Phenylobacterium sp. TaxID=1871053 RepID=UPI002E303FAD|nr:DUF423 domain-containing protein [Phenylobacterium sp.]HEX2558506.1 DUF423 domain-containing protein [Phenylobacterium sp.]
MWTPRNWMTLAAVLGLLAVAGGAFGAHGVADPKAKSWLQTGAEYALVHVLASFACGILAQFGARRPGLAAAFFLAGVALFSGSLFVMALGGPRWLGAVTPVGGLSFMIGWAALAWAARGIRSV